MEMVVRIQDLKHRDGWSYRKIGEELGVSSKTICKALKHPEQFAEGYRRRAPIQRPALGDYVEEIEKLLKGRIWTSNCGRRVRRTARWIYRQIRKQGYEGAESTVRTYVRQKFKQPQAACPIEHPPGVEAQFDFGQYAVLLADKVTTIHFVGATFPFSTRRFLFAYPAERQECLFDSIEKTYRLAGGVTDKATLDNTKLAVKKVLEGKKREETADYLRFRTTLGVVARYTNRAAGWEKGHVEGTVGWAKRQVLQDLEVASLEELDEILLQACEEDARERRHGEEGKTVADLFGEEQSLLQPIPYDGRRAYKTVRAKVSPSGRIYIDGSRYSVPIRLRGRSVRVRLFWDEVVATFQHEEVARHARDWSGRGDHSQIEHYLELLKKAPALLDHGKPFVRMPEWLGAIRETLGDDKSLVELLLAVDEGHYSLSSLKRACQEASKGRRVTKAILEQKMLLRQVPVVEDLRSAECCGLARHQFEIESPAVYDEILQDSRREAV